MPYLKRINSLPLINHISYKYTQVSDIGPSWSSCFALEFGNIAAFDFVYSLASTNINQSAPNLVTTENNLDFANYESRD